MVKIVKEKDMKVCEESSAPQQIDSKAQEEAADRFWNEKYAKSRIRSIEMRNLIFEALSIDSIDQTPRKQTFKMYGYCGCVYDLRIIVEYLAIKYGLVSEVYKLPNGAWGTPGPIMYYATNSNFNDAEDKVFGEEFHQLVYHNVISPGAPNSYGANLPYFHVTEYGLTCLAHRDILPYDPDGYLRKIKAFGAGDWELFYATESLICYNAGAYSSSVIMLGLLGEYLAEQLIDSLRGFLAKNETSLLAAYNSQTKGKATISNKYAYYESTLEKLMKIPNSTGNKKYPDLEKLNAQFDTSAKSIYASYVRLTRNELAHPNNFKIDRMECLMLFVCFVKYLEIQHKYINYFVSHS